MLVVYVLFGASRADVPVQRTLGKALGAEAGKIEISGIADFTDVDGSAGPIDLVCGSVGKSRRRAFAALVRYSSSNRRSTSRRAYWLKELVIQPPPGRPWLQREKELLGACARPATPQAYWSGSF
jgi:hypothetical protein